MKKVDRIYELKCIFPPAVKLVFSHTGLVSAMKEFGITQTDAADDTNYYGMTYLLSSPKGRKRVIVSISLLAHEEEWDLGRAERIDNTIIHELVHVVQAIKRHINDQLSDESEAYLLENLYKQAFDHYRFVIADDKQHLAKGNKAHAF